MRFLDWGLIDYEQALEQQLTINRQVHDHEVDETVVFCTHPPVVTVGRKQVQDDIAGWTGPIVEISRGGRATYHGPNQLVIYPILDLRKNHRGFKERDIHGYLRVLEDVIIHSLKSLGIAAVSGDTFPKDPDKSYTGVWVGRRKVASIGIGVKKWVTYHGVAVNLTQDEAAFRGIQPCGFQSQVMTSVQEVLGHSVDQEAFRLRLQSEIAEVTQG